MGTKAVNRDSVQTPKIIEIDIIERRYDELKNEYQKNPTPAWGSLPFVYCSNYKELINLAKVMLERYNSRFDDLKQRILFNCVQFGDDIYSHVEKIDNLSIRADNDKIKIYKDNVVFIIPRLDTGDTGIYRLSHTYGPRVDCIRIYNVYIFKEILKTCNNYLDEIETHLDKVRKFFISEIDKNKEAVYGALLSWMNELESM